MSVFVTKEFTFDCAHMLSGHEGLCKNLHGHTYKLQITVSSFAGVIKEGPSEGMIVDFKDLKAIVKERIVDKFDHSYVMWANGSEVEHSIGDLLSQEGMKVVIVKYRPTAENMAQAFYDELKGVLREHKARIVGVKVWETPTSYAEVTM